MRRFVPVILGFAIALATPPVAGAYDYVASDYSGDGIADTWGIDDNSDGRVDRIVIDTNQNGVTDIVIVSAATGVIWRIWWDTNLDGAWDTVIEPYYASGGTGALVAKLLWHDPDQNGLWDHGYYDQNLDGFYEWVMVDSSRDGVADTWVANAAPAGRTAVDAISAQVAGNTGAVNILHAAGLSAFFPASTIPLGG